jgi:hypothetical protein
MADSKFANYNTVIPQADCPSTIIDSRIGWTYEAGEGFMNIALGVEEEVNEWGAMKLPDTQALRAKVADLESRGFRTRFAFEDIHKIRSQS